MPWHPGEIKLQTQLDYKDYVAGSLHMIRNELTLQHREFHPMLPFVPLACIDAQGRPWASIIAGKAGTGGFIEAPTSNDLVVKGRTWPGDPLFRTLQWNPTYGEKNQQMPIPTTPLADRFLIAGVGIQYETRRRNKFAGYIDKARRTSDLDYELNLFVDETIGNCPKYINVRQLAPRKTNPNVAYSNLEHDGPLPDEIIDFIHGSDTIHVASYYIAKPEDAATNPSHAGCNSRGGRPGFARVRPSDKQTIVVPDFAGNRFLQSLGNISTTGVTGLTMFSWTTGDILYLTGTAESLVGPAAQELMPRQNVVTTVRVTGFCLVRDALPFGQAPGTELERSPYSPPIKQLREEAGKTAFMDDTFVRLAKVVMHSNTLATMDFEIVGDKAESLKIISGQAAVLDFNKMLGAAKYQHMAASAPSSVNDDRVRTWTISSPHDPNERYRTFQITMREKEGGYVTGALFNLSRKMRDETPELLPDCRSLKFDMGVVGVAGDFIMPQKEGPLKALWIAGGIGTTPYIAFLADLSKRPVVDVDAVLALSTREPEVLVPLIKAALGDGPLPAGLRLRFDIYTREPAPSAKLFGIYGDQVKVNVNGGRIADDYWVEVESSRREVWICGPVPFEEACIKGMEKAGVEVANIHREGFQY